MKNKAMKITDASITILVGSESTSIELNDGLSSTTFARIVLTPDQLSAALSRIAHTKCEIEVRGLEKLNKRMESKKMDFEIPEDLEYDRRTNTGKLHELAKKAAPKGWEPENYYASQDSFFSNGNKNFARVIVRRYVEVEPKTQEAN